MTALLLPLLRHLRVLPPPRASAAEDLERLWENVAQHDQRISELESRLTYLEMRAQQAREEQAV